MENELVTDFKKSCSAFDRQLRLYYDSAVLRGAEEDDINDIIGFMYDLNRLSDVDEENLPSRKIVFGDLKRKFENKKQYVDAYLDARDAELKRQQEEEEDEEVVEATAVDASESTKSNAGKIALGVIGGILLTGGVVHTGLLLHNQLNKDCNKEETVEETESENSDRMMPTSDEESKENKKEESKEESKEEKKEEEKTEENHELQPGEYGTFLDITDDEQVQARAQYLYDNYYAPNMRYIDVSDQHLVTVENIANAMRVMGGELPLDENGYPFLDGATVDNYATVLTAITVNAGSTDGEAYYHFPAYLLAVDGSELQEFIKSYDDIYDKLVYSMNVGDDAQAQDAIACLGYKFWNEWFLQGMHSDATNGYVNPHTFDADLRYFAFITTVYPYSTTGAEYQMSTGTPVCIEACNDYNTHEKELLNVSEIYSALDTGEWNDIIARLSGMEPQKVRWGSLFWEALDDQLNWKYDHLQQRTLN